MTLALIAAGIACLLSAAALVTAVRAFRSAEYAARVARGTRAAKLNLGPSRRPLEGRLWGPGSPDPAGEPEPEPAAGPSQPSGSSSGQRIDTRQMPRMPRPGEL